MNNRFVTAINCIDGRVQLPVIEWLRRQYGIEHINMVTEPGPERLLALGENKTIIDSIYRRVEISVNVRNAELIAVVGHHDCAGNPADEETQLKQILAAIEVVESWNLGRKVIGLRVDDSWQVHEVK